MAINKAMVSGNLTRDPELKETSSGMAVLEFGIAVNERRKGNTGEWEDYANFIDCVIFGKRAEAVANYLSKGTHVAIEAHIRQDRWEKDGKTRSKIKLIVDEIDFAGAKRDKGDHGDQGDQGSAMYEDDCPF